MNVTTLVFFSLVRFFHDILARFPVALPPTSPGGDGGGEGLVVGPSLIPGAGQGAFAARRFQRGEILCEYTGTPMNLLQFYRTRDWTYVMNLGDWRWVDLKPHPTIKARYINHHFDRSMINAHLRQEPAAWKVVILSSREIQAGEEVHYDYGDGYWLTK
jgi:hypothetical protein